MWKKDYTYSVLSGGMIASDVVEWLPLGADMWIEDFKIWEQIKTLLQNKNLKITIRKDYKNIELYGSLKNVLAILLWYYEWKWYKESTLWKYLVEYLLEMEELIKLFWWNPKLDFSYYSLGSDIIASCFGNGRNRYLWNIIWSWTDVSYALKRLKEENKHAEWYETLKWIYGMIKDKDWFKLTKRLGEIFGMGG